MRHLRADRARSGRTLLAVALGIAGAASGARAQDIFVPTPDPGIEAMEMRRHAQMEGLWRFEVFHDFRFTDRWAESGITFKPGIVDDAGRDYKAVHYDHGTGLAAADVDGDGRTDLYFVNQLGGSELWKNLGGGRFANLTAEAGVALRLKRKAPLDAVAVARRRSGSASRSRAK